MIRGLVKIKRRMADKVLAEWFRMTSLIASVDNLGAMMARSKMAGLSDVPNWLVT